MGQIGSFGGVKFEVSEKTVLTFNEWSRTGSGRWTKIEVSNQKPRKEFIGADLEQITFSVLLKADLGVNPEKVLSKWRKMRDTGKVGKLIIKNKPITQNYFSLESIQESQPTIDNKGNFWQITVSLTLEEYVKNKKPTKKKAAKAKVSSKAKSKKNQLGTMTITAKSIHIRSGPGIDNKVLGYAFSGNKLTVYKETNGWYALGNGKYISANSAYSNFASKGR
ncbi:phage tail protein [Viridibacillus arvi]|uniref:phage tail protein n=1 Tax=Viridibacillus arvi TaxID=263475 RepID=UPI0034CEBD90